LGNALMLLLAGWIKTVTGGYYILFMISASAYLVALGIFHLLSPRMEQAKLD
jgi:ACS family hexuronate transporter-like MFS transporter